jgi:hypothetical protein
MQGEARWDAFDVISAGGTSGADASPAAATLYHWFGDVSYKLANQLSALGDGTAVAGITGLVSAPTAASYEPGRVDVFVLGATQDGKTHVLQVWCDDAHTDFPIASVSCSDPSDYGWFDFGAPSDGVLLVGNPEVGSWHSKDNGQMEIVCTAADGTIRYLPYVNGAPTTWQTFPSPAGVTFAPNPTITGMGDHRYLIAAMATDGTVWQWLDDWGHGSWTQSTVPFAPVAIDLASY